MNIEELNTQLEYLKETKNLIKEQLIAKGQPVDDNTPFREYVDNMNDLVDTTDANAVTSDIATGKSGYVDGQKVDGNLRDIASGSASSFIGTNFTVEDKPQFNLLDFTLPFTVDLIHRQGSIERLNVTYDKIATPINLSSGQIKAGETILGIAGSVVELNGDTETVTPTTSQQIITPTSPKNGFTQVTVNAVTSAIDNNIQASNIKNGVSILGITGKSTVIDTEYSGSHIATADEIIQPYTVFLNGQQITGNMVDMRNMPASRLSSIVTHDHISYDSTNNNLVEHTYSTYTEQNVAVGPGVQFAIEIPGSSVASQIGLTANKIKLGETILGITGTYAGSTMKEYASETAMNNDIANIEENELVKVDDGTTLDYYIKDTTMVKLVKESETISPQDFEEAEEQIEDLFGEGENN